jgi:predicted PurR-regulated permease PerM
MEPRRIDLREHFEITTSALKRWFIATCYDALAVGSIWLVGLLIIRVPWAPFWAFLGGAFQFIPNVGPVFALVGPAIAAAVSGGFMRLVYVLILYAVIVVIDGLVLQPLLMKRTARVPIWASLTVPLILGFTLGFWGVLIAAPLLSVLFAYRRRNQQRVLSPEPGVEILPPEHR